MAEYASTPKSFRADINGLRAWAVTAVVLYHFGVPGFAGGFVGVDVFFVISGFLMTGIITKDLERENGRFSLATFYIARARRILPALLFLCSFLLILGWWLLAPAEYKLLATHVAFCVAFLSNFKFWREAGGYFDSVSHEKWLLHTWSLAVEWQFYLVFPLLLMVTWKCRKSRPALGIAVTLALLASLTLSSMTGPQRSGAGFYLLPYRAWEMLFGAGAWFATRPGTLSTKHRVILEWIGLLSISTAVICFDGASNWPGWLAVVPAAGTACVLLASRAKSRATSNPVLQWLGTRSYSIYLWHWPVVVALSYLELSSEPLAKVAGICAAVLIGHFSYTWIELAPSTNRQSMRAKRRALPLVACAVALIVFGTAIRLNHGVYGRLSRDVEVASDETFNRNTRTDECHFGTGAGSPECIYGGSHIKAIVIGDSHAHAVISAAAAALPSKQDGLIEWTTSSCPTLIGVRIPGDRTCADFVGWMVKRLESVSPDIPLIIINRHALYALGRNEDPEKKNIPQVFFTKMYRAPEPEFLKEYFAHMVATSCLLARNRTVYLVQPIPEMAIHVPNITARSLILSKDRSVSISLKEYGERNSGIRYAQTIAHDQCGVKLLDPVPYLCAGGICPGSINRRPLYYDDNHLSEFGNKVLTPMFEGVFAPG